MILVAIQRYGTHLQYSMIKIDNVTIPSPTSTEKKTLSVHTCVVVGLPMDEQQRLLHLVRLVEGGHELVCLRCLPQCALLRLEPEGRQCPAPQQANCHVSTNQVLGYSLQGLGLAPLILGQMHPCEAKCNSVVSGNR